MDFMLVKLPAFTAFVFVMFVFPVVPLFAPLLILSREAVDALPDGYKLAMLVSGLGLAWLWMELLTTWARTSAEREGVDT